MSFKITVLTHEVHFQGESHEFTSPVLTSSHIEKCLDGVHGSKNLQDPGRILMQPMLKPLCVVSDHYICLYRSIYTVTAIKAVSHRDRASV